MTDQPAAPTLWTVMEYHPDPDCARVVEPGHSRLGQDYIICNVFGEPEIATARAELFAAAPATAAERDRLKVGLERLIRACSTGEYNPDRTPMGVRMPSRGQVEEARAVLGEARK